MRHKSCLEFQNTRDKQTEQNRRAQNTYKWWYDQKTKRNTEKHKIHAKEVDKEENKVKVGFRRLFVNGEKW